MPGNRTRPTEPPTCSSFYALPVPETSLCSSSRRLNLEQLHLESIDEPFSLSFFSSTFAFKKNGRGFSQLETWKGGSSNATSAREMVHLFVNKHSTDERLETEFQIVRSSFFGRKNIVFNLACVREGMPGFGNSTILPMILLSLSIFYFN